MSILNTTYYHGSPLNNIIEFNLLEANLHAPFGPALYLTTDREVAECYDKDSPNPAIYKVSINGDENLTINLCTVFLNQSKQIQNIIKSRYSDDEIKENSDLKELLYPTSANRQDVNSFLQSNGVWMVYGKIHEYRTSGKMDRGIQFAVLDVSCTNIISINKL